jgi:hypothetical protein
MYSLTERFAISAPKLPKERRPIFAIEIGKKVVCFKGTKEVFPV